VSRQDARAGFTLIETLVALLVLSIVMVVAQRGFVTARLGLDRAQSTFAAEAVARSIVETQLDLLAAAPGVRTGETDGLAWTVTAEPIVLPLPPAPLPAPTSQSSTGGQQSQAQGQSQGDAQAEERKQAEEAAKWRPMRVAVRVANGAGRPLTIETLHLVKAEP
jgi:prepilin-type N-terminal cleavage/methylation domain-containing protein